MCFFDLFLLNEPNVWWMLISGVRMCSKRQFPRICGEVWNSCWKSRPPEKVTWIPWGLPKPRFTVVKSFIFNEGNPINYLHDPLLHCFWQDPTDTLNKQPCLKIIFPSSRLSIFPNGNWDRKNHHKDVLLLFLFPAISQESMQILKQIHEDRVF